MKKVVGIFGSASGNISDETILKAKELGKAIASNGCILLTGACPGLPFEAAKAAKKHGGIVIGCSPADNLKEHSDDLGYPVEGFDFLIFPGFGTKGRNVITVRSCDIAVFISGRIGTLNEFTIAYDEGKKIGILTGTGNISDKLEDIVKIADKESGASIIYESDPVKLIDKLSRDE